MVHHFCKRLSWGNLEILVSQLAQRIQFGVHKDLLDLLRLECMSSSLARALFDGGVTSLPVLASSSSEKVATILIKSTPFLR